jgi:hypothetical protein
LITSDTFILPPNIFSPQQRFIGIPISYLKVGKH